MKKNQKNSTRAFALRITLSLVLVATAGILLVSSFAPSSGAGGSQVGLYSGAPALAVAMQKVSPAVLRGAVRKLPQLPQRGLLRPEVKEADPTEQQPLPGPPTLQLEQSTVPPAPMHGPSQSYAGIP